MQTFRILRPDDARELAILHANAFEAPWSPTALRSELAKPANFGLALMAPEAHERIISFVLFQRVLQDAEMLTLATDPAHRQNGYATALLKTAFDHLTERGVTRCLLDVAADNHAAIGLYQSLGFKREGLRKAYYHRVAAAPVDAVLMGREMTGLP